MDRFEVIGISKDSKKELCLRHFPNEKEAVSYALQVSMKHWDDIFVKQKQVADRNEELPPFPGSVDWIGGYAYVVDATGRKIMSLLGTARQREAVARIICSLEDKT